MAVYHPASQVTDFLVPITVPWNRKWHPAFALINAERLESYRQFGSPADLPFMRDTASLRDSLRVGGRMLLLLACGEGRFQEPR